MTDEKQTNELHGIVNMALVITIILFSVVIVILNLALGWERWTIPICLCTIPVSLIMHIRNRPEESVRIHIYAAILLLEMFYYCANVDKIYDASPVIVLLLFLMAMTQEKVLNWLCLITGYAGMTLHILIAKETGNLPGRFSNIVRTVWVFVIVFIAFIVANWLADILVHSRRDYSERISELEEVNKSAGDFLANVSHEIRTPINAVMGITDICMEKESDPEIKKDMKLVAEAGRRVSMQISDILDYSEVDMKKLAVNSEDYMLSSVLHDLVSQIKIIKPRELELVIDVDPGIPSVMRTDVGKLKKILWHLIINGLKYTKEGGVYVHIYPLKEEYGINLCIEVADTGIGMNDEQLERVTERFYQANSGRSRSSNGLGLGMPIVSGFVSSLKGFMTMKSVPECGTKVSISIPQKVISAEECMSVADRERLCLGAFLHFEKFPNPDVRDFYNAMLKDLVSGLKVQMHKVETVENLKKLNSNIKLTHLFVGLEEYLSDVSYMEELTKKMVVVVVAEEDFTPGDGSGVIVMTKPFYCFPVISILNMDLNDLHPAEEKMLCEGVRALVVDDEPMNLNVATGIFKRYGMVVQTASSGAEALKLCEDNKYDIIFMDHMMPGMDGVEAMKKIRSGSGVSCGDIPIVALTANAVSSARQMFMREGFDGFVSKPVEMIELERVLKAVLPKNMVRMVAVTKDEPSDGPKKEQEQTRDAGKDYPVLVKYGVDIKTGLHYSQDDEDLYRELLREYAAGYDEKKNDSEKYLDMSDLKNYGIIVHALKSTSKMIGAMSLSDDAKALEEAAGKDDAGYIRQNHEHVFESYRNLTDAIRECLSDESGSSESDDDGDILEFLPDAD
ncbi:MAG: response regulator [Lachnospiraceae bacterium]|nr:response regulator [Lachnospiraceae bacterium]